MQMFSTDAFGSYRDQYTRHGYTSLEIMSTAWCRNNRKGEAYGHNDGHSAYMQTQKQQCRCPKKKTEH